MSDLPAKIEDQQLGASNTVRASWMFSADHIPEHTRHFAIEEQQALLALFRWCISTEHPMMRAEAARRLHINEVTLYKLYTGKYTHPETKKLLPFPRDLLASIRNFLETETSRLDAGPVEFVLTPTAHQIITAYRLALESRTPVVLFGPSHVGKTWTLRYLARKENHGKTALAELDSATGLGGMVRCGATALGISAKSNTADLIQRIKNALTPNMVMIWDEVHLLHNTYQNKSFFKCVETIRRIYDKVECGMILCWTDVRELVNAKHGELVQIWRRGVHKVGLPKMPRKADLLLILEYNGLRFPLNDGPKSPIEFGPKVMADLDARFDSLKPIKIAVTFPNKSGKKDTIEESPYEILRQVAKEDGLKAITERIRYARKLAKKTSGHIGWEHFVNAHVTISRQAQQEPEWT